MEFRSFLEPLLIEIEKGLQSELYLSALFITLAIPDICASLEVENPDQKHVGDRYKKWCKEYIDRSKFSLISVEDIYRMRCKALHNGMAQEIKSETVKQYILVAQNGHLSVVNCKVTIDKREVYLYSIVEFCSEIITAARKWSYAYKDDPSIQQRMSKLLRYHENGLSPIIVGVPVIA